jgi:rhomboid protease GluP
MATKREAVTVPTAEPASPSRIPVATLSVLLITGAVTAAQLKYPELLENLRRDPDKLRNGEWWRAISPMLVQAPAWQSWITVPGIAILGIPTERLLGARNMLALYLVAGVSGELFGYIWQPHGAGNSVADLGLAGGLITWLFMEAGERGWPPALLKRMRIWGGLVLAGAVADIALKDIHGLPTLIGACAGVGMLYRRRRMRKLGLL